MTTLKTIHVLAVALSAAGFFVRGLWSFREGSGCSRRWVRVVPHTVDTILLLSAVAMVIAYGWSPLVHPWLMTKLVLLIVYVLLGMVALRWGKTTSIRAAAWVLALATFAYITVVAVTKDPAAGIIQ